jgi:hypothetical protein
MFRFAITCLRERLDGMLRFAGGDAVAATLDPKRIAPAVDALEKKARALQAENRLATA